MAKSNMQNVNRYAEYLARTLQANKSKNILEWDKISQKK